MRSAAVMILLASLVAGCSLVTVRAPPTRPCTSGYATPVADFVLAAASAGAAGYALANQHECGPDGCHTFDPAPYLAATALVATTVFVISGSVGRDRVQRCRQDRAGPR